jgi:uncharacterized RmlC-like cupin family protein
MVANQDSHYNLIAARKIRRTDRRPRYALLRHHDWHHSRRAQTDQRKRTQSDLGISKQQLAQIPPNTCFDRHMHFGVESAYMLEGEVLLKIEGSPDRDVKAGSGTQIPASAPHLGCTQAAGAKVLTVHVVEKGKPLASPVP